MGLCWFPICKPVWHDWGLIKDSTLSGYYDIGDISLFWDIIFICPFGCFILFGHVYGVLLTAEIYRRLKASLIAYMGQQHIYILWIIICNNTIYWIYHALVRMGPHYFR